MTSFQIPISSGRRTAARFINDVRRAIQKALAEEKRNSGLTQSDVARQTGVHRSVINWEIRGTKDMSLGWVAELAHALGRTPSFELLEDVAQAGQAFEASGDGQQERQVRRDEHSSRK